MNTEKKVFYLFISLIVLMITCVVIHINDFKTENNSTNIIQEELNSVFTDALDKIKSITIAFSRDTENKNLESNSSKIIDEPLFLVKEEEQTKEEVRVDTQENIAKNENLFLSTSEITQENKELAEKPKEEVVIEKKIEEPLIIIDSRYIRLKNEKNIEDLSKETQQLQLRIIEYINKNPIIFKRGSNNITRKSNKSIKAIVKILEEFPNIKIEVAGHTDAIGATKLNQVISLKRAISVRNRLIYYKIAENRIIARGYGFSIPLVKNSPNGYSKINRRVEFNIIKE